VVTDSNRIGAEEDIDDFKGKTEEEIKELVAKRESKANAQILEMVGDIPDADAKSPRKCPVCLQAKSSHNRRRFGDYFLSFWANPEL